MNGRCEDFQPLNVILVFYFGFGWPSRFRIFEMEIVFLLSRAENLEASFTGLKLP